MKRWYLVTTTSHSTSQCNLYDVRTDLSDEEAADSKCDGQDERSVRQKEVIEPQNAFTCQIRTQHWQIYTKCVFKTYLKTAIMQSLIFLGKFGMVLHTVGWGKVHPPGAWYIPFYFAISNY